MAGQRQHRAPTRDDIVGVRDQKVSSGRRIELVQPLVRHRVDASGTGDRQPGHARRRLGDPFEPLPTVVRPDQTAVQRCHDDPAVRAGRDGTHRTAARQHRLLGAALERNPPQAVGAAKPRVPPADRHSHPSLSRDRPGVVAGGRVVFDQDVFRILDLRVRIVRVVEVSVIQNSGRRRKTTRGPGPPAMRRRQRGSSPREPGHRGAGAIHDPHLVALPQAHNLFDNRARSIIGHQ